MLIVSLLTIIAIYILVVKSYNKILYFLLIINKNSLG
nr:MAG TPA: hypothetical protein [Caudoviricetes sp.]